MYNYEIIDLKLSICESTIKNLRFLYKISMTVLIATIAVLTFDIYVYLTNPDMSKISIMMMGVLAANIVWFLGDIMMNRSDNKIERWNKKKSE